MTTATRFVGGDEIVVPFLLETTDGDIVDLATVTFMRSSGVWWRGLPRIPILRGFGIEVTNENPPRAAEGDEQEPHGVIRLVEDTTDDIPFGQIASLRLVVFRTADGITESSEFAPLDRIR